MALRLLEPIRFTTRLFLNRVHDTVHKKISRREINEDVPQFNVRAAVFIFMFMGVCSAVGLGNLFSGCLFKMMGTSQNGGRFSEEKKGVFGNVVRRSGLPIILVWSCQKT